jgi:thiosulfate dehydrogenase [quinone] large subunit
MPRAKKTVKKNSRVPEKSKDPKWKYFWTVLRISTGFIFLWPFLDKLFGFGISTAPGKAWINGVSPVSGFLVHGTTGPFAGIFQSMANSSLVAWLFMLGLLFVGLTMILGIKMKLGAITGTVMLFLMWLAELPITTNPFLDEHWFFAFALIASTLTHSGDYFGLGKWWKGLKVVKKYPILE